MAASLSNQPSTCNLHLEQRPNAQHPDIALSQDKPVQNSLLTRNSPRYNTEKKTTRTTSILICWYGDNKKLLEPKTTTSFGLRISPKEEQVQNVILITGCTDNELQLYYQSSPTTTGYRPVRPYLESEALIRLAACFSITTATLYMIHWMRTIDNSSLDGSDSRNAISPSCTAVQHIALSRYASSASNRSLAHIRNCIIYAVITELWMSYNHNYTVSKLLCAPKHSKWQKSGGSRKTSEHRWGMASPPFCGPAAETPAPQDPMIESNNHALYDTISSSLIDSHKAISTSCDKISCTSAYLQYTADKSWRIPYLCDPDKVLAKVSILTMVPHHKSGSEIFQNQLYITTYSAIREHCSKIVSRQSHLIFVALLNTYILLLPFHCYRHDFNSATCIATVRDETTDTADGDKDEAGRNGSSQNQSKPDDSKSRRRQITSRGALFNGSRHSSLSSNGDDGDGEDENNEKGSHLLLQCQSSTIIETEETEDDQANEDTEPNKEASHIAQTISQLTAVVSEMKEEVTMLKAESRKTTRMEDTGPAANPIWNMLLEELKETRRENKDWFKELNQQIQTNKTSTKLGLPDNKEQHESAAASRQEGMIRIKEGEAMISGKETPKRPLATPKSTTPKKGPTPNAINSGQFSSKGVTHSHQTELPMATQGNVDQTCNDKDKPRESYRRRHVESDSNSNNFVRRRQNTQKNNRKSNPSEEVGQTGGDQKPRNNGATESSVNEQKASLNNQYRARKCLIIHDPYFDKFDETKFSRWYDVSMIRYETLQAAKSDTSLLAKVKKIGPEVVFLHVGQADLLNKAPGNSVVANMKELIRSLAENTQFKLCISLIIPLPIVPQVRIVIKQVNREISDFISEVRKTDGGKERVFTQSNDALGASIHRSTGIHGIEVSLNDRGLRKLWLHLRDGLNRSLNLNISHRTTGDRRPSSTTKNNSQRSLIHHE